jgi:hypothetical protein
MIYPARLVVKKLMTAPLGVQVSIAKQAELLSNFWLATLCPNSAHCKEKGHDRTVQDTIGGKCKCT